MYKYNLKRKNPQGYNLLLWGIYLCYNAAGLGNRASPLERGQGCVLSACKSYGGHTPINVFAKC